MPDDFDEWYREAVNTAEEYGVPRTDFDKRVIQGEALAMHDAGVLPQEFAVAVLIA
jgi:hypothetical protein